VVDRLQARGSVRTAVVWRALRDVLDERVASTGRARLDILDTGGGTGGFAVPLATLGHSVTVVDPSPDSLAALERRAAEAGVSDAVRGVQGDAAGLLEVVAAQSVDVVLCHSVLEVVDDPTAALAAVTQTLRPGGVVSVLAANRAAVVVHRAVAGRFEEALHALRDPAGRYAPSDPVPRRFASADLELLVASSDLTVFAVHAVRVFADLVPGGLLDSDPMLTDALLELEAAAAERPEFRDVATQLHMLARRP
jgi:SAM-dependent methyltransferase